MNNLKFNIKVLVFNQVHLKKKNNMSDPRIFLQGASISKVNYLLSKEENNLLIKWNLLIQLNLALKE